MAKASEKDMEAALLLLGILNDIDSGQFPRGINGKFDDASPDHFDEDEMLHLLAFYQRIKYCLDAAPGGLTRVIGGFHTVMHNNIIDPDDHCLALHPRFSWISFTERQPEKEGWYAVVVADPDDIGWETKCWWRADWRNGEWRSAEPVEDGQPVTHWMELPDLPKIEAQLEIKSIEKAGNSQ